MTKSILGKIMLLSLLERMKNTTATFAVAMCNIFPAITFLMAYILRLEKVKCKSIRIQAKVVGTLTTVGGAMATTLVKGPVLDLVWTKGRNTLELKGSGIDLQHLIKGSLMITTLCSSWACLVVLEAITPKTYPAELSPAAWICPLGTVEGAIVALVMERGKATVWSLNWDTKFLAAVYSGIFCSGLAYYVQGVIMKDRSPVFVTAFNPLSMIIVAVMSSFILAEKMYLGRVIGAIVMVVGLYLVVWGKSKDYKSLSPSIDEQKVTPEQMIDACNQDKENGSLKVVTIRESSESIVRGEQTNDKRNQTTG